MADPVVVAKPAAMAAIAFTATMSTEVIDYTNFDGHTYLSHLPQRKKMSRGTCATSTGFQGRQHSGELVVNR